MCASVLLNRYVQEVQRDTCTQKVLHTYIIHEMWKCDLIMDLLAIGAHQSNHPFSVGLLELHEVQTIDLNMATLDCGVTFGVFLESLRMCLLFTGVCWQLHYHADR